MMQPQPECPNCGGYVNVDQGMTAAEVKCDNCGKKVVVAV